MIKCIIIDDEPLAAQLLASYAEKIDYLEVMGVFSNPLEALSFIQSNIVDLALLDIQMPEINGTQLAKIFNPDIRIIFTTAYPEHAVEGFELNAVDYLVKPINFYRFLTAINKVSDNPNAASTSTDKISELLFIKTEHRLQKVKLSAILYFKGMGDYVQVITEDERIMTLENLSTFDKRLTSIGFIRTHKSYLVALDKITFVQNHKIKIREDIIPIGRKYQAEFYKTLNNS